MYNVSSYYIACMYSSIHICNAVSIIFCKDIHIYINVRAD